MAEIWLVNCPKCGEQFEVKAELVQIHCGQASADCTCPDCGHSFKAEEDYLIWLGFEGPVPAEIMNE